MTPLEFEVASGSATDVEADVILVPFAPDGTAGPGTTHVLAAAGLDLQRTLAAAGVEPRVGSLIRVPTNGALPARAVALICVADEADMTALRQAAATAGRGCRDARRVATTLHQVGLESTDAIAAVADGLAWGRYEFLDYKSDRRDDGEERMREVVLVGNGGQPTLPAGLDTGVRVAAGDWVRDLVNIPPCHATPAAIAADAARIASRASITSRIWQAEDLAAAGLNAIVAVGSGSANAPCMVELRYEGGDGPRVALVGKGITFDSGGLDLKQIRRMVEMKNDMAGAAAVIAATWAAGELGLDVNIVALAPLAENLPGAAAMRPGDVVRHPDGSTTEIISPDSEGRLVLADALAYLSASDLDAIVDVATLTGDTALGIELWALMGSDPSLNAALLAAGERAGDPGWELPLWRPYERLLTSSIADRTNGGWNGGPYRPGTMIGGLYLSQFVNGRPWAHLDVAATAEWAADAADPAAPLGPTGSPTAALIAWLESLSG